MPSQMRCPTCLASLTGATADLLRCPEGHDYTPIALSMATNRSTVEALWLAIRALEDDAAGLRHLARLPEYEARAQARLQEAEAAAAAAARLRQHAEDAQRRLESLALDHQH